MCGLVPRILSRRSRCSPVITAVTTISAITPTKTPPIEIRVISERKRIPRREAR
jgi:hypothetical protein